MQCEKTVPVKFFFFILKPLQGDSGGPLWVREEEGGNLPTAYLVQSVNYFFLWAKDNS